MSSQSLNIVAATLAAPAYFGYRAAKGLVEGEGISAKTLTGGLTGEDNAPSDALKAQRKLEEERRAQLAGEAATRADARRRAETSGQRAGAGGARSTFLGGLGFGSGNTPAAGRGNLFGN